MIRFHEVKKSYRLGRDRWVHALEDMSMEIHKGEFISIVGPSGSGKSTFLALAGMIDRPTEGQVWFDQMEVTSLSDAKRASIRSGKCGFVFQFPSLIPTLTSLENVMLPKTIAGRYETTDENSAFSLLEKVGLTDKAQHLPYQLSGGEQRRVAMARALMNEPEVVLADEPTGALDQENALIILDVFKRLNEEGKTILMVTHDLELAEHGHRLLRFEKGKLV
ncbi:ABC transporter ATP-binding protein [Ammoniphilus sp. CFH 90114]|uniref:ABC transporter ATP-binding protein n=1 Tax=Ammoniphilus sp. CFH 90114 TaxID=2493665 RepID=UPI00100F9EF7|nr:ABC transporter ATP-binding protein [Ammoniphilus sp. CFH 90114]RXT14711.1 ABC transporter ATP-binding protein [Ammoniphilus sp. CFH 90114]